MSNLQKQYNQSITIKGTRVNNLQNVTVEIPRNKLVVITGLSGSGKSSLAFDTLYAEGQRRYVESLSAYARQFLGRMQKPEVDFIHGIPPAIAIEQKVNSVNPRSTVGTSTEIYEYLKLLYARIGQTISPKTGNVVRKHSVTDVVNFILSLPLDQKILLIAKVPLQDKNIEGQLLEFKKEGLSRMLVGEDIKQVDDIEAIAHAKKYLTINLIVDRLITSDNEEFRERCGDSTQSALLIGKGQCFVFTLSDRKWNEFSIRFEEDGVAFEEPSVHMFSFNSPLGACPVCDGYGKTIGIDPELVIPDKSLSVYEDAVACWRGESSGQWKQDLINAASKFDFPIHRAYSDLTKEQIDVLWNGNKYFEGINNFFKYLEESSYKIQNRVMLARFRGKTTCPACLGSRLKPEAHYVKVGGKSISELVLMPISALKAFFDTIQLTDYENKVAGRLLTEIKNRINFLLDVGLGYLTLNRTSSTLSGGESQRINLATALGSCLTGSLYILDEPSIGLHSRDTDLLIKVLQNLKNLGNTVVVVEHDEEIMRAADHIIDMGPFAGRLGGKVIFEGNHQQLEKNKESLTAAYLTGKEKIEVPHSRRKWNSFIKLTGARENNLKGIDVKFPLHVMTVVTGVSGSGKSSLVKGILYPALSRVLNAEIAKPGNFNKIEGDIHLISGIEYVDQNPIGRSSRSNPVTFLKAYDEIRKLYASVPEAVHNGFTPTHFSFNVEGGRCEVCQGDGHIKVEMQFMPDVTLVCENCKGMRFKDDILEIRYHGKNIYEVLEMTVEEAIQFFSDKKGATQNKIVEKLQPLFNVGLGYIKLGQSSSTLSGGESQRVKLASYLSKENSLQGPTLFIFDEPTTGLHFHDIKKLLDAFDALISHGHSLIIIEHNPEVIKYGDWIIDLGPEGGDNGGNIVFEGTPENLINERNSYTGRFIKNKLQ